MPLLHSHYIIAAERLAILIRNRFAPQKNELSTARISRQLATHFFYGFPAFIHYTDYS